MLSTPTVVTHGSVIGSLERIGAEVEELWQTQCHERILPVRPFSFGIGVMDDQAEARTIAGRAPFEHLKVSIRVASDEDWPYSDMPHYCDRLATFVVNSHSGMSVEEFQSQARNWLATARHPETHRPYTDMVYQPMLELLSFLRNNSFKTYIVSGGGVDLMRTFAEDVYGIPPYQVIGRCVSGCLAVASQFRACD